MNQQKINTSAGQNNWSRFINHVMHDEELEITKIDKPLAVSSPFKYQITAPKLNREDKGKGKEVFESTCSEIWIG